MILWSVFLPKTLGPGVLNTWPDAFFAHLGVWLQQPDEHFTNAFEIILCHIWWSFYFYISGNAWGFWGTCYVERIRISTEGKSRVYPSELFLLWRLWIVARKSYFRKSLGGVILERSKVPPGYAVGKQGLVFWWNEETSERTCSLIFFSS